MFATRDLPTCKMLILLENMNVKHATKSRNVILHSPYSRFLQNDTSTANEYVRCARHSYIFICLWGDSVVKQTQFNIVTQTPLCRRSRGLGRSNKYGQIQE